MSARRLWWLPLLALCACAAAPATASVPRLAPTAEVRVLLTYPACSLRLSGQGPIPVGLIGLDRRQAGRALGELALIQFTPQLLVVERAIRGCPVDYVTLVARAGMVEVLAGPRGATTGPGQPTGIPVRALPITDVHRLEGGWTVSADALEATLRTLRSR